MVLQNEVYYGTCRKDPYAQLGLPRMEKVENGANYKTKRICSDPEGLIDNRVRFLCTDTLEVCSVDVPFHPCLMVHFYTEAPFNAMAAAYSVYIRRIASP